jgi:hypothetical protein
MERGRRGDPRRPQDKILEVAPDPTAARGADRYVSAGASSTLGLIT